MKIATLLASLSNFTDLAPTHSSAYTMQKSITTWGYFTALLLEESSNLTQVNTAGSNPASQEPTGTLAALVRGGRSKNYKKGSIGPQ